MKLISIDWDFFFWNGMQAKESRIAVHPNTKDTREVPAWLYFDWGHSESYPASLMEMIWPLRALAFKQVGLEMEQVANIRPELGCTTPGAFLLALADRFLFNHAHLHTADSHAWGYPWSPTSGEIISFDAHCDLGYGDHKTIDCASWLYHALKRHPQSTATIVYPDWRDMNQEWPGHQEYPYIKKLGSRVRAVAWSDWLRERIVGEQVASILLVRSSSWTPPYLDPAFAAFARKIPCIRRKCLDCNTDRHMSDYNGCIPRQPIPELAL